MKPVYITTSIAYTNANPHIGYALELVQADFLARYYRLAGKETYFLTGVDEHGLKLQKAAAADNCAPQQFVDSKAEVYQQLLMELGSSHDRFIRTTDPDHALTAQALWRRCLEKGDIYRKRYQAWYNIKEEEFIGTVAEIPDPSTLGIDPKFIEKIDEENYFFALSKYQDQILAVLESGAYAVLPASRLAEIIHFVKQRGLQDISISREASKLSWGIPVPDDPEQVMYVWFDALSNYLTGAGGAGEGGLALNERWPADIQVVGKDIIRFHALIWAGILLSADLALPKQLLVHGFLTSGGQKMSKSVGNVIDPLEILTQYGRESVRWFLLKEVSTTGDADFTAARLEQVYLADLANDLGNLVSRVWSMCGRYCGGKVPISVGGGNLEQVLVEETWTAYHQQVAERSISGALEAAHALVVFSNRRIEEQKPWVMAKDPYREDELKELLYELLEIIRHLSLMLKPALPDTAESIRTTVFPAVDPVLWSSFDTGSQWGLLPSGLALGSTQPILFPKTEK